MTYDVDLRPSAEMDVLGAELRRSEVVSSVGLDVPIQSPSGSDDVSFGYTAPAAAQPSAGEAAPPPVARPPPVWYSSGPGSAPQVNHSSEVAEPFDAPESESWLGSIIPYEELRRSGPQHPDGLQLQFANSLRPGQAPGGSDSGRTRRVLKLDSISPEQAKQLLEQLQHDSQSAGQGSSQLYAIMRMQDHKSMWNSGGGPYYDVNADGVVDLYDADGDGVPDSPIGPTDTKGVRFRGSWYQPESPAGVSDSVEEVSRAALRRREETPSPEAQEAIRKRLSGAEIKVTEAGPSNLVIDANAEDMAQLEEIVRVLDYGARSKGQTHDPTGDRARRPCNADRVACRIAASVGAGHLAIASMLVDTLVGNRPDYAIGLAMRDVLDNCVISHEERGRRIGELGRMAADNLAALAARTKTLVHRLDERLLRLALGDASKASLTGLGIRGSTVLASILLADADDGRVKALKDSGVGIESVSKATKVVIGRVPIVRLATLAMSDGVKRMQAVTLR